MKASQRQFLVSVYGLGEFFATISGGEVTADVGEAWDGGKQQPDVLSAPAVCSNLTVTRPYDPNRDQPIITKLQKVVGRWQTTLTKQPTDADFTPIGKPTTYPRAMLVRVTPPEGDAASADAATYELEFKSPGPA